MENLSSAPRALLGGFSLCWAELGRRLSSSQRWARFFHVFEPSFLSCTVDGCDSLLSSVL